MAFLHRAARKAAIQRAFGPRGVGLPALGISYNAMEDVEKATRKLFSALNSIIEIASTPLVVGRGKSRSYILRRRLGSCDDAITRLLLIRLI